MHTNNGLALAAAILLSLVAAFQESSAAAGISTGTCCGKHAEPVVEPRPPTATPSAARTHLQEHGLDRWVVRAR